MREEVRELSARHNKVTSELKAFRESFARNNYEMVFMPQSELV